MNILISISIGFFLNLFIYFITRRFYVPLLITFFSTLKGMGVISRGMLLPSLTMAILSCYRYFGYK